MKEIEPKKETKIEIVNQVQQKKQEVLIGKMKPQKGHTVWEFNRETFEIVPAEFEKLPVPLHVGNPMKTNNIAYYAKHKQFSGSKIIIKKNCFYVPALNKRNAAKVLIRDFEVVFPHSL